ncbi:hypothetical protein [Polaromonas sp.]|uniref:hypothetical protein n=1 Tax=Polaromonas sp. TaxID=1869339 RepID=UPI002FCC87F0
MNLTENLGDFNRRMADELRGTFAATVKPFQSEDGGLLFRGPIEGNADPHHVGTHVAVSLEKDVHAAMEAASPEQREEMVGIFLSNLGTRVKMQYDPKKIGQYALDIVGTMRTLRG